MILLHQGNLNDGAHNFVIPAGKYREFCIIYAGTADAGQTATANHCGTLKLIVEGREVQNIHVARLQSINLLKGGIIDTTSGAGAAFSFSCFLPFHVPGDDGNVLDVTESQKVTLQTEYDMATIVAGVGSGAIRVYGILSDGVQAYLLKIGRYDMNLAVGTPTDKLPQQFENVYELFMENNTNLTALQLMLDGIPVINSIRSPLISKTHFINRIETWSATIPYLDLLLSETKQLQETLSDSIVFAFQTSGAISPLKTVIFALDFTPSEAMRSAQKAAANLETKMNRKRMEGKTRPITTLQVMQGKV